MKGYKEAPNSVPPNAGQDKAYRQDFCCMLTTAGNNAENALVIHRREGSQESLQHENLENTNRFGKCKWQITENADDWP